MKKYWKKCIAISLALILGLSVIPVYAMEQQEGEMGSALVQEQNEDIVGIQEENHADEVDEQKNTSESALPSEVMNQEVALNYIYVESPYLETPAVEKIAVSLGDGTENISEVKLQGWNNLGEILEIFSEKNEAELYLFTKEFVDENESGNYSFHTLSYKIDGIEKTVNLEEKNAKVEFGVNQENSGVTYSVSTMDDINSSEEFVAEINNESTTDVVNEITEAIQNVVDTDDSTGQMFRKAGRKKNDKIVVALDPGHDVGDAGAGYNGLREEQLTLEIANYCKEELENYSGVEVYMTRTSSACPYGMPAENNHAGKCIRRRVKDAANAGADVFVSLHLNAATAAAKGAEIIIPNASGKPEQYTQGKELAQKILSELTSLGLYNRGFYFKNSTDGETYGDGKIADYFTVQNAGKEYGVPGIIVEHAFISNVGGVDQSLLSSAEGRKKLGIADAKGIANYFGLAKTGEKVNVKEGTYTADSVLAPGKSLRVRDDSYSNGANTVISKKSENHSSQRFEIVSVGNKAYKIIAEHSGKALGIRKDASGNYFVEQQNRNDNAREQEWNFINAGDGSYYIMSALGVCMDVQSAGTVEGNLVWAYANNKSNAQKWKLNKSNYKIIENGTYTIHSGVNNNRVLSVENGGTENFGNVQIDALRNISSQNLEVQYVDNGYYKITFEHSGKALDILNGSGSGANLQQYDWNGSNAQLWKFIKKENGTYSICSKLGTVIDLSSLDAAIGSNVYMTNRNNAQTQTWTLKKKNDRPVKDGKYVISNVSNSDVVLSVKKSNVELSGYTGAASEVFSISYVSNGYYRITSTETGKALDVHSASPNPGANLWEYDWNGSNAQLWKFIVNEDGSYTIKSKLGTVIDAVNGIISPGQNVQMYTMNGSNAQKWKLEDKKVENNDAIIEDGTYNIFNSSYENRLLTVSAESEDNFANVELSEDKNSSAQQYEIKYVGNGYYRITAEHSGKALDVANGSNNAGANVWQYSWNHSDAQLWKIKDLGNGSYKIQSKLGTFMAADKNNNSNIINVQMTNSGNSEKQIWKLKKVSSRPVTDGTYRIYSSSSNLVVGVNNSSNAEHANVHTELFSDSVSQKVQIEYVKDGYYKILFEHSQKALTVADGSGKDGVNVEQRSWDGKSDSQLWKFVKTNNGFYIRSKVGTVLDIWCGVYQPGTNIWTYASNGSEAQKWSLKKEPKTVEVEEGIYTIQTALKKGLVIDIESASKDNFANAWLYSSNNTDAQKFKITKVGREYYKIESVASGKVLDIANGSKAAGANVWQYSWNGSDAQLWKFFEAGDGKYYIQSKLGTVLDVTGASTVLGTNVQMYILNESVAQKWELVPQKEALYSIMGTSDVTVSQMVELYNKNKTVDYPYEGNKDASSIVQFCEIYKEECEIEGVKTEVAFSQAMLETGFLKFGGDVSKEQYNFAGIGAVGNGAKGEKFDTIRIGIRAHIQHLKAYASTEPLKQEVVDPRFKYVKRGCAPYVQWLGQKENPSGNGWATDKNYGYKILEKYILPLKSY